jgi:hypothetical protein
MSAAHCFDWQTYRLSAARNSFTLTASLSCGSGVLGETVEAAERPDDTGEKIDEKLERSEPVIPRTPGISPILLAPPSRVISARPTFAPEPVGCF